jgi:UDP-glucose 4-epimerase
MSKILITGGAGFIGSQLGYQLKQEGNEVILVDNLSYGRLDNLIIDGETFGTFHCVDIRSKDIYTLMKDVDYVFHFAGIAPLPDCQSNPCEAIDVNVAGTANVLDAARYNGVKKVIFSSTSAIYENNKTFPSKETDEVNPTLIYSNSKLQSEMLCKSFVNNYGLDVVILRFFNVYGPHQDLKRKHPPLIGYVIRELFYGRTPILHSDGKQERDYVYMQDVIDLCKIVMRKEDISGEIFNVATSKAYSVRDLYKIIADYMKSDVQPEYNDAKDFWEKYPSLYEGKLILKSEILEKEVNKFALGTNDKSKDLLGWEPKVSINQGLINSINYAVKLLSGDKK